MVTNQIRHVLLCLSFSLAVLLGAGNLLIPDARAQAQSAHRPNIIMIVPHDLGQHLGCYGVDEVRSPNIDRLADQGIRFENMYSTSSVCTPGRASLHTGRYPQSNGLMGLSHSPWWWSLNDDERHTAQYLKELNYSTHLIGKSHLGESASRLGYDHRHTSSKAKNVTKKTQQIIRSQETGETPFFAKVGYQEVHRSFTRGEDRKNGVYVPDWFERTDTYVKDFAKFQAEVHFLDKQVGKIMNTLRNSDVHDNTLVIFTAEHGIPFPGAKWTARKAGLEIPLIMYKPDSPFYGGTVIDDPVSNIDILPTLLDYLGAKIPDRIQGKSFGPTVTGESKDPHRKYVFGQYTRDARRDNESRTVITKNHQLIWYASQGRAAPWGEIDVDPLQFRKHEARMEQVKTRPFFQLYDLQNDPYELNNIASKKPEVVKRLKKQLRNWMESVDDPLLKGPMPKPYYKRARDALGK